MKWLTKGHYDNGEYHLRLVAWDRSGDQLVNRRVMPLCGTDGGPAPVPNHLRVYKRAIVNCSDSLPYRDFTFYSVTLTL